MSELAELKADVKQVLEAVVRIEARWEPFEKMVLRHEGKLTGNGREGIETRLEATEQRVEGLWETFLDFRGRVRKGLGSAIVGVVSLIVTLIGAVVAWGLPRLFGG